MSRRQEIESRIGGHQSNVDWHNEQIARLEAELETVPGDTLTIESCVCRDEWAFEHDNDGHLLIEGPPTPSNTFTAGEAKRLRDWLNHHYPVNDVKEDGCCRS